MLVQSRSRARARAHTRHRTRVYPSMVRLAYSGPCVGYHAVHLPRLLSDHLAQNLALHVALRAAAAAHRPRPHAHPHKHTRSTSPHTQTHTHTHRLEPMQAFQVVLPLWRADQRVRRGPLRAGVGHHAPIPSGGGPNPGTSGSSSSSDDAPCTRHTPPRTYNSAPSHYARQRLRPCSMRTARRGCESVTCVRPSCRRSSLPRLLMTSRAPSTRARSPTPRPCASGTSTGTCPSTLRGSASWAART